MNAQACADDTLCFDGVEAAFVEPLGDMMVTNPVPILVIVRPRKNNQSVVVETRIGELNQTAVARAVMPMKVSWWTPSGEGKVENGLDDGRKHAVSIVTIHCLPMAPP